MSFRFAAPWALALLPAAVAVAWALARRRRRADARLLLPRATTGIRLGSSPWVRLERALPWLRGLGLLLLVLALARPQAGEEVRDVSTYGVDIVVALDISASMRAEDFQPRNRLGAARETVARFVEGRPSDRIGLVIFGSLATTRCPLTLDHALLQQLLAEVDFAPPDQQKTAIGLGLATAANRLRRSEARSKVIVLVTDGENTAGQIGPRTAAEAARALGVKVYTIGVGSNREVPVPVDLGPRGTRYTMQRFDLDEELLREIASLTGGRYFLATDTGSLESILATIDELEPTEIESRERWLYAELFPQLLAPGLILLLLERLLLATRLARIP